MTFESPSPSDGTLQLHRRYDPDRRVVALTGASGFLGRELIRRLEADPRYQRVLAIDVAAPAVPMTKTHFHKIDLTQPNADAEVAQLLKAKGADTLVHLAFLSRPTHNGAWAHELEAIGSLHVLNACGACALRKVVMWSLTALYGARSDNPNYLKEDAPLQGMGDSRFIADKLEAERLTLRFADENPATVVTVLRTAPILGRRVNNYVSRYFDFPVVPTAMGYDPLVQLLGEDDAITAFKICVDADYRGCFNIAGDGVLPLSTILALAGKLPVPVPYSLAVSLTRLLWVAQIVEAPPRFIDYLRYLCVADTRHSHRELAFQPRQDIRQIVRAFADPESEWLGAGDPRSDGHVHGKGGADGAH